MPPEVFRAAAQRVAGLMADYVAEVEHYPVLPRIVPGVIRAQLPTSAPDAPEPLDRILEDYARLIEPNITHWQHPGFFAYFSSSGAAPGILGDMLVAALIGNAMLWRTAPAATELEETTVGWLREALGLRDDFDGLYTDTASTSSLMALAAARQVADPGRDAAEQGIQGGAPLRVYASQEAHSSIEKAAMTLGLGRRGLRRVPVDADLRLEVTALRAALDEDLQAGIRPAAVVATLGTTSSTSVDPLEPLAALCRERGIWLHVDAAYAGAAALLPEMRETFLGWERADSIVVNPHKWLFTRSTARCS